MSYLTVVADVKNWLHRDDLDASIPMFITFAEAKFNQRLRVNKMEKYVNTALTSGLYTLPADFIEWKWLKNLATNKTLASATVEWIKNRLATADQASVYAIDNGNLVCYPSEGQIEGFYYGKIPELQVDSTNWLDDLRHDLYVYETLSHACMFISDFDRSKMYEDKANVIIKEIQSSNNAMLIGGSPLVARNR